MQPARLRRYVVLLVTIAVCTSCDLVTAKLRGYPGRRVPVVFTNQAVRLNGLLLLPRGAGPFPAIVLVHGSGPWVIDDNLAWQAHARAFQKRGFAVLVYDKRGAGASTGRLGDGDYQDLARDVVAGVELLRGRRDIEKRAVGLLGYSEGGWVSLIAAHILQQRGQPPAFLVFSSAPAVSPATQTLYANTMELQARDVADSTIAASSRTLISLWDYYRRAAADSSLATAAARQQLRAELAAVAHLGSSEIPRDLAPYDRDRYAAAARRLFFEPVPLLETLSCPLLAAFGAADDVVDAAQSAAILRSLAKQRRDISVRVFPGVGHSLIQKQRLIPAYAAGYLDTIAGWARQQASKAARP
ncbi:MAG TPA: alpha/beta fold hydrolase [Longimicrobiales bacterium]